MGVRLTLFMRLRHYPFLFKMVQRMYDNLPMTYSVLLHLSVVFILVYDFSSEGKKSEILSAPIFVVDLESVKISERTNLPPTLVEGKKKTSTSKSVTTSSTYSKATGSRGGVASDTQSSASSALMDQELTQMLDNVTRKNKKKEVAASNSIKSTAEQGNDDPFKTLFASVDGIKSGLGKTQEQPNLEGEELATKGIDGGSGGSYAQELSVSEKDLLGMKLRHCWNLDPGVQGAQNMLVEIRTFLNQDGSVKDVQILNNSRYGKDIAFRSVAESARRAVYICDKKGPDSPFKLFPKYYPQAYESWKTLLLRFNPFDGGVG